MGVGLAANPYTKATFGNYMSGHALLCGIHLGVSLVLLPQSQVSLVNAGSAQLDSANFVPALIQRSSR